MGTETIAEALQRLNSEKGYSDKESSISISIYYIFRFECRRRTKETLGRQKGGKKRRRFQFENGYRIDFPCRYPHFFGTYGHLSIEREQNQKASQLINSFKKPSKERRRQGLFRYVRRYTGV